MTLDQKQQTALFRYAVIAPLVTGTAQPGISNRAFLLVGLPQLNHTLNLSVHEPLCQRFVMNYHMEGMTKEEGKAYIKKKAGSCRLS